MKIRRNPAAIPALIGVAGLVLGLAAAGCVFVNSIKFMAAPFAVLAALCSALCGLSASRMAHAVAAAEVEINKAIDLLVAQNRKSSEPTDRAQIDDSESLLPDQEFFELAVRGRVASARRHLWPISIVLVDLRFANDDSEEDDRVHALNQFIALMRQTLRESDVACKLGENAFGIILEDTSEEGGVWTAERLQIALAKNSTKIRQISAGVATYPTHALHADEILKRAHTALARAAATTPPDGLGRVEVAHVDLS